MKHKILFIERKPFDSVSIERVFDQIIKDIPADRFDVEVQKVPYGNSPFDILRNLLFFRPKPADIYHITGHVHYMALRLPKKKTVLTIHDLIFLRRRTGLRRYVLKKLFLALPLRKLKFVTSISQATKEETVKQTGCDPKKIRVIENPLSEGFDPDPIKPFDEKCPVILQVGTTVNKNIPTLIKALIGLTCKLRIIGRLDDKIGEALDQNGIRYENTFDVGPKQMIDEYRNADIVTFCSTYEGFGLPIIEAQAMKKPVITSDLSPMKEIAGPGACLANPNDAADIRTGLLRMIKDSQFRGELIRNGYRNVQRFTAKKAAAEYVEIYNLALNDVIS